MVKAGDWTRFAQDDKYLNSKLKNDIVEGDNEPGVGTASLATQIKRWTGAKLLSPL
jgi:hypothetical protein